MWKSLLRSIREYKKPSILAPVYVTVEVIIECAIPFITALLVNQIKAGCGIDTILWYGLLLLVLAGMALTFGRLSGAACATAASGAAAAAAASSEAVRTRAWRRWIGFMTLKRNQVRGDANARVGI